MEVGEVRRQLRHAIEKAKRKAAAKRAAADQANQHYATFLSKVATPVFHQFATSLRAEGYGFTVHTPAGGLRLASESSGDDFIELALDSTRDQPTAVGRASRSRGRRVLTTERPIREDQPIEALREEDVLAFLLAEIEPFVER